MTRRHPMNLVVFLIIGAVMTGCAKQGSHETYSVNKQELSFAWQYPSGWVSKEFGVARLGFSGTTFTEKQREGKDYQAFFAVVAKKAAMFHLTETTLESVARDAAVRCLKFEKARILRRQTVDVAGRKAEEIDVVYQGMTDIYSPAAKKVALREILIIVPDGELFYTLRYVNTEEEFGAYEPLFRRAVKTFRFVKPA